MMGMRNIYDQISKATEEANRDLVQDYVGDDGLIYCGKCNTRKQSYVKNPFTGIAEPRFHMCACRVAEYEKEKEQEARREFERKVQDMRKAGFSSEAMERFNFRNDDNTDKKLSTVAHNFVDHFDEFFNDGKGLLLHGDVGTGKTFSAACIANALIDKGIPCMMTNFIRLINIVGGMYEGKQNYIDGLNRFRLLIIDDLDIERNTDFANEIVYSVIDNRVRAALPMVITTNLTLKEMSAAEEKKKKRIYDRVFGATIPVKVEGGSRRRQALNKDYEKYKNMLGI